MYFLTNALLAVNRTFKQIEEIGLNAEKNWSENYNQGKLDQSWLEADLPQSISTTL